MRAISIAIMVLSVGCVASPSPDDDDNEEDNGGAGSGSGTTGRSGSLSFATYNVAGLPALISGSNPATNTAIIGEKLNKFDLAVVQEDFSYHDQLTANAAHPHESTPGPVATGRTMNDGVNTFSMFELAEPARAMWTECNGVFDAKSDCLASKGLFVAAVTIAPGVVVDVYVVHMDAGRDRADMDARDAQSQQLAAVIASRPHDRAFVIAGDTNMKDEDEPSFTALLAATGSTDACRAQACPEPYRIDRVLLRSSSTVTLTTTDWTVDTSFVDGDGEPLSDHELVSVTLTWTLAP